MKAMTVGRIKAEFSDVIAEVRQGTTVAVEFGRNRKRVALIVPYPAQKTRRTLGVMEGRASYAWQDDPRISDEELLNS